jgi:hypothetical protein
LFFGTRSAAAGSRSGGLEGSVVARCSQDFLSSGEILFCDDDFLWSPARQAIHHPDAKVRRPQIAGEPFRSQERAEQFRFVCVRYDRQVDEPGGQSTHPAQELVKVIARGMNVEQAGTIRTRVRKRMHNAERCGDERAGSEAKPLVLDEKLGLSFEHVERIDVVVVGVRVGSFETRVELELDEGELVPSDLDRRDPVLAHETFAFAGKKEDGFGSRAAAPRWSVDAVETAGLTAIALLQIPCEATVRRVEVQEARTGSAPEAMDDLPRSAHARARGQHLLLVVDQDSEPALEDVERIRVLPVEVRIRSLASIREERLRDAELVEVRLDHDPSAEERLALAGSVHDSWHCERV